MACGQREEVFVAPNYTWAIEILVQQIRPDASAGEAPELPRYEVLRPGGSTVDVDFIRIAGEAAREAPWDEPVREA